MHLFKPGWVAPEAKHYARLSRMGEPASSLLSGTPSSFATDLRYLISILDQENLGTCTANAIAQILRGDMIVKGAPPNTPFPSRLWLYSLAVALDGHKGKDVGTQIATIMKIASEYGFPPESLMPYDVPSFGKQPSMAAWDNALVQRRTESVDYHPIMEIGDARVDTIIKALSSGKLVAFGTELSDDFKDRVAKGTVQAPGTLSNLMGGHAMVICGHGIDPFSGRVRFLIANSWGQDFGDDGFFWMDVGYITWYKTWDLWCVSHVPVLSVS